MGSVISVIVPVYNAEKTIEKTYNSIFNQLYTELEIIFLFLLKTKFDF